MFRQVSDLVSGSKLLDGMIPQLPQSGKSLLAGISAIALSVWVALLCLNAGAAYAQPASAALAGTVMDEAGAVIPAVNNTALNLSTALQRHATTDNRGAYLIPLLPPGRYNMTAERSGFTTVEIRNLVLNTGDQLSLRVKLIVGQIGASVTVIEDPSSLQQSTGISTVVNR